MSTTPEPLDEAKRRLARAAYAVDGRHQFGFGPDGLTCTCGFVGSARMRTQTEHITQDVMEAFDHE